MFGEIDLEFLDSPYRSVIEPLIQQIRKLRPNPSDAVAVVVPEFVVGRWWQHLLHGQTALLIKTALLFEPNVIVIDVPFAIGKSGPDITEIAEDAPAQRPGDESMRDSVPRPDRESALS